MGAEREGVVKIAKKEVVEKKELVTMNLFGIKIGEKKVDASGKVPDAWVNYLDIDSGEITLKKCSSSPRFSSSISSDGQLKQQKKRQRELTELQDLNLPPFMLEKSDLSSESRKLNASYAYPCTLDNVKSALKRVKKESSAQKKKRSQSSPMSLGGSSSSSSPPILKVEGEKETSLSLSSWSSSTPQSKMFTAGCPKCLLYVLISSKNPKCPRCDSIVPSPVAFKKPVIDLNISV